MILGISAVLVGTVSLVMSYHNDRDHGGEILSLLVIIGGVIYLARG